MEARLDPNWKLWDVDAVQSWALSKRFPKPVVDALDGLFYDELNRREGLYSQELKANIYLI